MSTISASTTTTTGYVVTSDTTGTLVLQTGASPTTAVTIGSDQSFNFSGTGQRITGDFSNATLANRVMFQTSTANGNTGVGFLPNGTSTTAFLQVFNAADPTNSSYADIRALSGDMRFSSSISGTGTYLPMTFYTGGSEAMRITNAGTAAQFGFGTTAPAAGIKGDFQGNVRAAQSDTSDSYFKSQNSFGNTYYLQKSTYTTIYSPTAQNLTFDINGNVLATNPAGGLGYGTGSGGTVTQATSKSTAVTLNKPTGQITLNSSALAAGATAAFVVTNSIVSATDTACVHINSGVTGAANYRVGVTNFTAGSFIIFITNVSAGSLSEAAVINFAIIKGSTS